MKKIIVLLLLLFVIKSYGQKQEIFGPIGAVWLYENEGVDSSGRPDTVVKFIKITTDTGYSGTDPFMTCHFEHKPVLILSYLRKDSSEVVKYHVGFNKGQISVTYYQTHNSCSANLYVFNNVKNFLYTIAPLYFIHSSAGHNSGPLSLSWYLSFKDSIIINGKKLAMLTESDSSYKNNKCISFCSPIIERIGSLGFMFPIHVCSTPFYGGRLISYYDPDFGYWKVPDSMRNMACSFKYINASVEDQFKMETGFKVYPNPFQTSTTLDYNLLKTSSIQISLFDINGKQINILDNVYQPSGNYQLDINAEKYHLNPGIYLLKFQVDGEYVSRHVVKF